jgi:hypothetical protein
MGSAAEIDEVAFTVQPDRLAVGDRRDDLGLVLLADRLEEADCRLAVPLLARDLLIQPGELPHPPLDGGQVVGREGALIGEVVVEAVLDDRADGHLRLRVEVLDRIRQQVGCGVADDVETFRVLVGHDGDPAVRVDPVGQIHHLAVDFAGECRFRKSGPDRRGNVGHRHGLVKLFFRTVWKGDNWHESWKGVLGGSAAADAARLECCWRCATDRRRRNGNGMLVRLEDAGREDYHRVPESPRRVACPEIGTAPRTLAVVPNGTGTGPFRRAAQRFRRVGMRLGSRAGSMG